VSAYDAWLTEQAEQRERAGLTRRLSPRPAVDDLIDLAGNDYLSLARHPEVIAGAVAAATEYGGGAGASRLVSGSLALHRDLEEQLAAFTGFATALVHSTGYHANLSVIGALTDADTLIVADAHIHASLIDACRLSRAERVVVAHNDLEAFEAALAGRTRTRAVVLVESIYSVLGDAAPLPGLAALCGSHDALLVVDEAHALGVSGPGGRGECAAAGVAGAPYVVATATLSKALGAQGGVVLGSSAVRDQLVNRARPFIYDTGLAPASAGAALAALRIVAAGTDRTTRVLKVASVLAGACGAPEPAGAVLASAMPGPAEAVAAVEAALRSGVRIGCFRPPSTPDGISRLRLTAHAGLTDVELDHAVAVLSRVRS
jgi:8-amino-7-oxononanoate synthase